MTLRTQILQIPGDGITPTDADMERVGELCLRTRIKTSSKGQTVRFQGLSNANAANNVFRPLARAWEEATGATIEWIDVTQADSYPKMAEAIASNAVDFDVLFGLVDGKARFSAAVIAYRCRTQS
ncbi:MAG: phosphate/phosphite/phosphonate ABC transporter substrate-binding protein [Thermomicrobiales bacterium]|nr:phosphate/phosphite/phosphonate ABC transporter substrate-binding protein [Thermomicrobiales bacterium]